MSERTSTRTGSDGAVDGKPLRVMSPDERAVLLALLEPEFPGRNELSRQTPSALVEEQMMTVV